MKSCVEYECVHAYILVFKYTNSLSEESLTENTKKESRQDIDPTLFIVRNELALDGLCYGEGIMVARP